MLQTAHQIYGNHLLRAMQTPDFAHVLTGLEWVDLPLGKVLYESGAVMTHAYFPTTAIVSLLYVLETGASAEIAVVGKEGMVGIALFMGGNSTPSRAVVQSAGNGFRLRAATLKNEFDRAGPFLHLLLRYTQALLTQMSQTAVCNRHHSLDPQLCRWLLLSLDRLSGPDLIMTQELISNMLGVRREGVTAAAQQLQAAGLIRYSRATSRWWTGQAWKSVPASATRWSRRSTTACCPMCWLDSSCVHFLAGIAQSLDSVVLSGLRCSIGSTFQALRLRRIVGDGVACFPVRPS